MFQKPGYIHTHEDDSNVYKKLDISRLSVYWNCADASSSAADAAATAVSASGAGSFAGVYTIPELKRRLSASAASRYSTAYVLEPLSATVRMERNTSKFPLKGVDAPPRFRFDVRPERIEAELSRRQLAQIRALSREWARFDRARAHRKWRPQTPVKNE